MNNKKEFKLIAGDFTPQDAKEILTNLYSSKINFHLMKNFSSTERFGKSDQKASKRVLQLKESMVAISAIIQQAIDKKKKLVVTATVHIDFKGEKMDKV